MPEVREINDIAELDAYRAAWAELLAHTPAASFFQSLAWLETYWRHFGAGQRLRTLVVCEGGRPTGIVPLTVFPEHTRLGTLRTLTYPLHNWGSFYGPVGPAPAAALTAALRHLRRGPRDWDLIELRWLGGPGPAPGETARAMRAAGCAGCLMQWEATAWTELRGTWDAFLASRPRAWRRNLRHAERKLAELGPIRYERYRSAGALHSQADPRWDLYDACEDVARRSWQAAASNGTTLCHASVRAFLRDAHAAAAAAGAADINLLFLADEPVAFAYNYVWQGRLFGLRLGYDAAKTRDGAGNLLLAETLRDSFARGDRAFDLGAGALECKRHFATHALPILRCSHYRPLALRAQLLRAKRWLQSRGAFIGVGRQRRTAADAR